MMRLYSILVLFFLSLGARGSEAPVFFTKKTSHIHNMALGQQQILHYAIHNNVQKSLPLHIGVFDAKNKPVPNTQWTASSSCDSNVSPNGDCVISLAIQPKNENIKWHLNITYGGRSSLTSPISLHVTKAKYTVLIYIVGSDLQSRQNFANFNIKQMLEVGSNEQVNIVLETGGAKSPGYTTVKRQMVYPGSLVALADLGNVSMRSPSIVHDFLLWGVTQYPADRYIAIFWNQGGGPNSGFGGDENNKTKDIAMNDLAAVINKVSLGTGTSFELIGFDACLMGSAEMVASLVPHVHYFLASEDLEPGKGWQYNTFLSFLKKHPNATGAELGRIIIDGYTQQNVGDSTTLSLIDAAQLDNLKNNITQFARVLSPYLSNAVNWKSIAQGRFKAAGYKTSIWDEHSTDVVDLVEFVQRISSRFPGDVRLARAAQGVIAAVNQAVLYYKNSFDRDDSFGLSVYFPSILEAYKTQYPQVTSINGKNFFSQAYVDLVSAYHDYYQNNVLQLAAAITDLAFDGVDYTATVSNDYNELYAAVGSHVCDNLITSKGAELPPSPCYNSIQYTGITARSSGSEWDILFNKAAHATAWPLLNGMPVLLIPDAGTPSNPDETNFLIPAHWVNQKTNGYLNVILNQQNEFSIVGFQITTGSANTASKIFEINVDDSFLLRSYAQINSEWGLMNTNQEVSFPLNLSFGAVPAENNNGFGFLTGDLTGALHTSTPYFQPY